MSLRSGLQLSARELRARSDQEKNVSRGLDPRVHRRGVMDARVEAAQGAVLLSMNQFLAL
jgi:hypothetical protein